MVFSPFSADATKFLKELKKKKNLALKTLENCPQILSQKNVSPRDLYIITFVQSQGRKKKKRKRKKGQERKSALEKKVGSFFPPSNFHRMYVVEEHYLFACFDVK